MFTVTPSNFLKKNYLMMGLKIILFVDFKNLHHFVTKCLQIRLFLKNCSRGTCVFINEHDGQNFYFAILFHGVLVLRHANVCMTGLRQHYGFADTGRACISVTDDEFCPLLRHVYEFCGREAAS
jgi:hypothetical protein